MTNHTDYITKEYILRHALSLAGRTLNLHLKLQGLHNAGSVSTQVGKLITPALSLSFLRVPPKEWLQKPRSFCWVFCFCSLHRYAC